MYDCLVEGALELVYTHRNNKSQRKILVDIDFRRVGVSKATYVGSSYMQSGQWVGKKNKTNG